MNSTPGSWARLLGFGCTAGALALGACTGEVDGGPGVPNPAGPGAGTSGEGGSGGSSGNGSGGTGAGTSGPEGPRDPGRVTMRRLNRVEYDNTVRDLLGTEQRPGRNFLNDAPQFGFDNNADHLTLSPVQADLYQKAAEALASEALSGTARARFVTCDLATGDVCLQNIVTEFGAKAYRRPLLPDEVAGYVGLAAAARSAGATPDEALRTVFEAILISPHFLFRVELDPDPTSLTPHVVAPYEMASRLSYLVYRSMPDKPLFDAAAAGKLSDPSDIEAELERMLADPKGATFAHDFVEQWLGTRILDTAQFDPELFPRFNANLALAMKSEVAKFFEEFVRENRPVQELVTANFSYLDDSLAAHYGLPLVGEGGLKRTAITSPERGGLLTMAAPLAVTSYPTRTSVVRRGAWVLGELLCSEPPPPPPEVDGFPDGPLTATTQRELLAMHRMNSSCNACHQTMDNMGLALENFDALGVWRTMDAGKPIDARGSIPSDGRTFDGARELSVIIAQDPKFPECVAEHMLSYALGRSVHASDAPYVHEISTGRQPGAVGVRELLTNIVASDTFRMRRGEQASQGAQP